jgi:hypothetical protein
MKPTSRRLVWAALLVGTVLGVWGVARAQQGSQGPPVPPPDPAGPPEVPVEVVVPHVEPPPAEPAKVPAPPAAPSAREPARSGPAAETPPAAPGALPPGLPLTTGHARDTDVSIKDIILESEGPTQGNPTGRQEPGVSLQWICPPTARLNQPVLCTIIIKSLSANRLHQVVVRNRIPAGVVVKGTEPRAVTEGDVLVWRLGSLEPRQEKRLDLSLVPTTRGSLACNAFVTFTGTSTAKVDVREPKLILAAAAPKKVTAGDPATIVLTVSNPGDAPAERVKVRATLTDGLENASGKTVEFNLDNLGPNEGRTVLVQCAARGSGPQVCSAVATAEPGLSAKDSAGIEVLVPRVSVAASGPAMRYLDRHAVYTFKVTNPGTATANHVTVTDVVPAGFKVVSANEGGRHDFASRSVVWFLGDLGPGASKDVSLDLVAINPGEYRNRVTVTAARGLRTEGEVVTRLEGLPGLLMELVDVEDPVEVGRDDSYEIRVTNTGTKTETNLQLTCTVPEKMQFKAAKGPFGCPYQVQGREVVFAPLPRLAPRADVIYRVSVHCVAPGDLRFQAKVRADGLERPVLREESTRVYGDEREAPMPPR